MKNAFLMKDKKVSDIRIFQPRSVIGELYHFPKDYLIIATKYVDNLKERKFLLKGNNYFMIQFDPNLKDREIVFEHETKWDRDSKGTQEVNVGFSPQEFNNLSEKEKSIFIVHLVASVLIKALENYNADTMIIKDLEKEILKG